MDIPTLVQHARSFVQQLEASAAVIRELCGVIDSAIENSPILLGPAAPIDSLDLSVRAFRLLKMLGVRTVGQVTKLSRDDLRSIPHVGTTTVAEIETALEQLGLKLREADCTA